MEELDLLKRARGIKMEMFFCECGFKCVEGQLAKTGGECPRCKKGRADLKARYAKGV